MFCENIVGLISDTHGLLRPEVVELLKGSDFIVHAGDVGRPEIIGELARMAPVTVVRGNVDTGDWGQALPATAVLEVGGGAMLYVLHDIADIDLDPAAAGFQAVIFGHSHKPGFRWKDGVLYINPGSAGPQRFSLPVFVGRLTANGRTLSVALLEIQVKSP